MKQYNALRLIIAIMILTNCNNGPGASRVDTKGNETGDTTKAVSSSAKDIKVTAHLIYQDGSTSSFDVLNDKTIALWNTVIGAGDAEKPSESIRVNLSGESDSLHIRIRNGKDIAIDQDTSVSNKGLEYIIKNTGCEEVYVDVLRNKMILYRDTIPFHCGE